MDLNRIFNDILEVIITHVEDEIAKFGRIHVGQQVKVSPLSD